MIANTTRQKYARIDKEGASTKVTYFIGNVEIEYSGGGAKYKRQLGNYAILTETGTTTDQAYLFTDHLGSIDTITDENGNTLQSMSFSAWGERRLPTNWNTITVPTIRQQMDQYTNRGFTGHEMVDAFGIINMGGRLYDAALGRVLQADPFVQDPTNTQSFNRYTYVFNNPLSYTDPSGYTSRILKQFIGFVIGVIVTIGVNIYAGPYWAAFAAAFSSSYYFTGNLRMSLKSGLTSAAIAFISTTIITRGANLHPAEGSHLALGGAGDTQTITALVEAAPIAAIDGNATSTAMALEETSTKISQQAAPKVVDYIMNGATVIADSFREFLIESIRQTWLELWQATQTLISVQQFKRVSLGQGVVEGNNYDISTLIPASNLDKAIALGTAVLIIAATIPQAGRNFVKNTFGVAKGKVAKLFARRVDPNRLNHIFDKVEHNLDDLVKQFGSPEKTFNAVQKAANKALKSGNLSSNAKGILPGGDVGNIIKVGGKAVRLIGGRIDNGKIILSSFSRKGL